MNREQMVNKAATAIAWEPSVHYPDALQLRMHVDEDLASEIAAEIVDAILPQVTTVEELEALPTDSVIVAASGFVYQRYISSTFPMQGWLAPGDDEIHSSGLVWRTSNPLTVVWSPS